MSTALSGVLSVDKRVILFAILIGMSEGYLYVFSLHVNDRIKGVDGHSVGEEVGKSVARKDAMAVVHDGKPRIEIGVVAEHCLHDVVVEGVAREQCRVGLEEDEGSVLVGSVLGMVAHEVAALKLKRSYHSVAIRPHLEMSAQCVDRLHTHTVQSDALLERLRVVLASGVEHRYSLDELTLGYAAAVVAHRNTQTVVDIDFDATTGIHLELVDRVVDNLLEQHVDAVLRQVAVAQTSDVHTGARTHMLHVGEVAYVVVGILDCWLYDFFFHYFISFL